MDEVKTLRASTNKERERERDAIILAVYRSRRREYAILRVYKKVETWLEILQSFRFEDFVKSRGKS